MKKSGSVAHGASTRITITDGPLKTPQTRRLGNVSSVLSCGIGPAGAQDTRKVQ